ncbi:unnamed protein product [Rotaria magnacalcarata]|uniref:C4H2-type domain-containing protein n=1 Tax=Rotaria magnacalcarata TaxID=392030 RepID=A0A816RA74_9BILA|nr:unnamed protein product [Rotaria magnacalcarata]CAF1635911.1 unnamed protein product [Rotaria magnacalcarata]CAF2031174.1 unnamed protein product [Rotaria magnacalcarata]CAF2069666.1 unnamed protein product [Rotaria magnacalcarata]CAF2184338.1 unnamed protein product [Rotaria magnacalcarata]
MENPTEKTPSSSSSIDERDLVVSMRKLDLIKELGDKQNQLQRIQSNLNQNTDTVTRENQVLREFRKELDMLVQERMSHIEELRLIHADINIMETTIKQAEEERIRILQESRRLLKDYQPMKEQINNLRDVLNLEKVPDNEEDEVALMTMQLIAQQSTEHDPMSSNRNLHSSTTTSDNNNEQHHLLISPFIHPSQQMNNSMNAGPISTGSSNNNQSQASGINASKVLSGMGSNIDRSAFRQQPPPMKTCQSCQQQIHRNAPICPICKAKSRSRNPKKPKRRHLDINPQ